MTAAIRTPDQRLRVFVSSTLAEMAEERAAVARAITGLQLTPVMFELGVSRLNPTSEWMSKDVPSYGLWRTTFGLLRRHARNRPGTP